MNHSMVGLIWSAFRTTLKMRTVILVIWLVNVIFSLFVGVTVFLAAALDSSSPRLAHSKPWLEDPDVLVEILSALPESGMPLIFVAICAIVAYGGVQLVLSGCVTWEILSRTWNQPTNPTTAASWLESGLRLSWRMAKMTLTSWIGGALAILPALIATAYFLGGQGATEGSRAELQQVIILVVVGVAFFLIRAFLDFGRIYVVSGEGRPSGQALRQTIYLFYRRPIWMVAYLGVIAFMYGSSLALLLTLFTLPRALPAWHETGQVLDPSQPTAIVLTYFAMQVAFLLRIVAATLGETLASFIWNAINESDR